jgi:hypothetical protein
MNVIHMQRGWFITRRLGEIDREVAEYYADDYLVDVDRLLDERIELAERRDTLVHERVA